MPTIQKSLTREALQDSIASLFQTTKQSTVPKVGLEVEFLPLQETGNTLHIAEYSTDGKTGVFDLIKAGTANSKYYCYQTNKEGTGLFNNRDGGNITFEPSSQVEYSSSPQPLAMACQEVTRNFKEIAALLKKQNITLLCSAINPWHTPEEVGLKQTKARYVHMNSYYNSVNEYGRKMMRMTTALQISIDLQDSEINGLRWTVGNLLTPFLTAIFGNSPFAEGKNTHVKSFRTKIWNNLDPGRTGIIVPENGSTSLSDIQDQYLAFALNAAVMRLPDQDGGLRFQTNQISFQNWLENGYNGFYPDESDWQTHLTTLFPAIRPKGFLEFRGVDGQTRAWWAIPAIFLHRLMYDSKILEQLLQLLQPYASQIQDMQWRAAVSGLSAFPKLCHQIFKMALEESQAPLEAEYLLYLERFYQHYTAKGITPADELLFLNDGNPLSFDQYKCYESCLLTIARPPQSALFPPLIHIDEEQLAHCLERYNAKRAESLL